MHCQVGPCVVVGAMKSTDQGLLHPASPNLVELGWNSTGAPVGLHRPSSCFLERWFALDHDVRASW